MAFERSGRAGPTGSRGVGSWSTEGWRASAVAWIDEALAERGERRTSEVGEPRIRAWATVFKVPTSTGPAWFKAASHETAAEVALYGLLAGVVPRQVLQPIAVDVARGWLLLPDGGTSLAASLRTVDVGEVLERLLPEYGALQLALAPHVPQMLVLGMADMRPARMPARFHEAAAAVRSRLHEGDRAAFERALESGPSFEAWARELAESPVPDSIDHNDLHAANILVPSGDPAAPARFYDWGDAVVSHPFATMLHGLGWVPPHLGVAADDPQMLRLRDAYLGAFTDFGTHADLVRTLELACRVAKVARCLSWSRAIGMGDEARGFERAPIELFTGIPDASYLSPV
ncbi:phosphotransferase [Lysobacter korlensis]|uniref:Phosphotransferase n=1 Tax=Lysobacter korlensis TaxID=553636 RepID=A0ABV6RM63_9GAMM